MANVPMAPMQAPPGAPGIPGMNQQPYPALGPGMGGVGPGAESSDGEKPKPDNIENIARLLTLFGIQPGDPRAIGVAAGLGAQSLARMSRRGDEAYASRGITDEQTGVQAQGVPGQPPMPQLGAPMPPMMR